MIYIKPADDKVVVLAQHAGYVMTVEQAKRMRTLLNHAIHMAEGVETRQRLGEVVHRIMRQNGVE